MEMYVKRGDALEIYNLFPGSWGSNCYIIIADENGKRFAAVVDPSASATGIIEFLKDKNAKLEFIVLTHGHFDHIMSLDKLREATGADAYIHKDDEEMLLDGEKNAFKLFFGQDRVWQPAEKLLQNGDKLSLGKEQIEIISTPGHSKGSICLLCDGFMITGDTLFADNIGRCDLHGGNMMQMYSSLSKLAEYNADLTIYPGHGDSNTLGNALSQIGQI